LNSLWTKSKTIVRIIKDNDWIDYLKYGLLNHSIKQILPLSVVPIGDFLELKQNFSVNKSLSSMVVS